MDSQRPGLSDLRAHSHSSAMSSNSRLPRTPRVHVAGEAPPELSPLDAFALQSRLLARQLKESNKDGNRMSRLPPLTMESPLVLQGRSGYFRSLSQDDVVEPESATEPASGGASHNPEIEDAFANDKRPMSMHPRMSRIAPTPDADVPAMPPKIPDVPRGRPTGQTGPEGGSSYFGARRERSPSPLLGDARSQNDKLPEAFPSLRENAGLASSPEAIKKEGSLDRLGLVPPPSLFRKRSPSALSGASRTSQGGDDNASGNTSCSIRSAHTREGSSGSGATGRTVQSSALGSSAKRSPSSASESSALQRPSFNFSRPLSRAGTPAFEAPSRQASSDSQPSFILADDSAQTPISMNSDAFLEQQTDDPQAAPSYIYSKFSLPRGKTIQRSEPSENTTQASFQWEQPVTPGNNVRRFPIGAPPSPPSRPSTSSARTAPEETAYSMSNLPRPSLDAAKTSLDSSRLGVTAHTTWQTSRVLTDAGRKSEDAPRGRAMTSSSNDTPRGRTPASAMTSDSASTIRPPPSSRSHAPTASEMSAEEHLAKGIECHEKGSLNESTYHLRLAARQNNPTAMLLYALACRHGWGMRPNQREGVQWLRKAVEYASVVIADDEEQAKDGQNGDLLERKARKAQFALSIYELGVSHMNGWGIEQDKALALRCFEIAGNWGDVDALAEAGFCYAQGLGCKKNLKKSAQFYRMAEAKGMSMIGNSWIHKAKYDDDESSSSKKKKDKKKARSKSRTRTMFGLKSS